MPPPFLARMSAAIRMGTPGPAILDQFLTEREFWKQLGLTREDLRTRPHREIAEYTLIISLIQREEARRNTPPRK